MHYQRGNALIFALLALVLTSIIAVSTVRMKIVEARLSAGKAEASVLQVLGNGASSAMLDMALELQAGLPFTRIASHDAAVVVSFPAPTLIQAVTPGTATVESYLVWRPSIDDLKKLGYLTSGWSSATTSMLNNLGYDVIWRRRQTCGVTVACDVEGWVVMRGAIRETSDSPGTVDGPAIAPILQHFGAESGISLPGSSGEITGWDNKWKLPNPVPGTPPGVVAVHFGTASNLLSRFVRLGDTRDPNLQGPLSVAGPTSLNGGVKVKGELQVMDAAGKVCTTLTASGDINLACNNGALNAKQATFDDGAGNKTNVNGGDIKTTGSVTAGDLVANKNLSGHRLQVTELVVEGAPCTNAAVTGVPGLGGQYAQLNSGGLAMCNAGRWIALNRFGQAGEACANEGATATDSNDRQSLLCRRGLYTRTSALVSSFVLMETVQIPMTAAGPTLLDKPICPMTGATAPEPLLILTGANEAPPMASVTTSGVASVIVSGINRYGVDVNPAQWAVHLERSSDNTALQGVLIGSTYCFYP